MAEALIRIISDLHYGDRASAVSSLDQLCPLLDGTEVLLFNGDTGDTRPGPHPEHTRALRKEIQAFVQHAPAKVRFVTGNHDPDISQIHSRDLAGGEVFVTHGDLLFDNVVPWGNDAAVAGELVRQAREAHGDGALNLQQLLEIHRHAAKSIPQRHQSERHGLKYLIGFLRDTVWPINRIFRILRAWRETPRRAEALLDQHRPQARFIITGHVHRAGVWRLSGNRMLINTGSFCPPSGRLLVELTRDQLRVRQVDLRANRFHPGKIVAQFALTFPAEPVTPQS